jgi:heptosyltransferase-2
MATPTLRAMRQHFGADARLLGIMRPAVAEVLAGASWLNEAIPYDPRSANASLRTWPLVRRLRQERLDLAVLLTNSFRTAWAAWLSGARQRMGYNRYGRGWLLTDRLSVPMTSGKPAPCPMVEYYLKLAAQVGCPASSPRLELATSAADEAAAKQVFREYYLRRDRVVVINSSGAFGAAKLWPVEHFAQLARRVAVALDHDVLVICGPQERDIAGEIERQAAHPRVVSLARHPLSLGLSKACVRWARLMVSTDSGPRHFAVAFGVPVVTLFGPTHPRWVANPTAQAIDVHINLGCLACQRRTCPLGHHRCMRELSVQTVFEAVENELARPARTAA